MLDRMTAAIDFHGKALQLRAQRQEVLSSNIANADTPGFKARDFDFSAALRNATGNSTANATGIGNAVTGATRVTTSASASVTASSPIGSGSPRILSTIDGGGAHLLRTQAGHLAPAQGEAGGAGRAGGVHSTRLQYTTPEQGSLDGNSVDLNRERASFAENSLHYEATLRFINGRVRTMITAIRGE